MHSAMAVAHVAVALDVLFLENRHICYKRRQQQTKFTCKACSVKSSRCTSSLNPLIPQARAVLVLPVCTDIVENEFNSLPVHFALLCGNYSSTSSCSTSNCWLWAVTSAEKVIADVYVIEKNYLPTSCSVSPLNTRDKPYN